MPSFPFHSRSHTRARKDDKSSREERDSPTPPPVCGCACIKIPSQRGPRYNRACIWQYLTCFRKRSLVTEMRSRSDNSYVEYYTVEELPLVPYRASDARPPAHARCAPVSNFRIIRPLSAIRQFRQFRNGTWECGARGGGKREEGREEGGGGGFRLQTTLKFDRWWRRRTRRIWGHRNFSLSPAHGRPANLALRCMYTSKSYTRASCAYRAAVRGGSIPRGLPVKRCNQL